ncbi:MAG: DUF4249 domain-containing protein [Cyclobacteriaceae bacterium]
MMNVQKHGLRSTSVYLVSVFTLLFFASCEDVLEDFEVPNEGENIVVDGRITDHDSTVVRISRTAPYFSDAATSLETGATVRLKSDMGLDALLAESSPGVYSYPDSGIIDRSYHIEITLANGDQYISDPELLKAVPPIDTAYWGDVEEDGETKYEIYFTSTDVQEQEDYYRWLYYVNGVLGNIPNDIAISDDDLYDGNEVDEITLDNDFLELGDKMSIEQLSISKEYFSFLEILFNNTADQGSPFSSPPAPLIGNVRKVGSTSEFALGYFNASAVVYAEVIAGVKNF